MVPGMLKKNDASQSKPFSSKSHERHGWFKRIVYKNAFTRSESGPRLRGDEKRCEGTTHHRAGDKGVLWVTEALSVGAQANTIFLYDLLSRFRVIKISQGPVGWGLVNPVS
jgi:hypothetical protein